MEKITLSLFYKLPSVGCHLGKVPSLLYIFKVTKFFQFISKILNYFK